MNIRFALFFLLLAIIVQQAMAQSTNAGNTLSGRSLSAPCASCHGVDGNSQIDLYPSLAGQHNNYLMIQLKAIQNGDRAVPLMTGQLDSFSAQDLVDLAAYYAGQQPAVGGADIKDTDKLAVGEAIYRGGRMDKGVAACIACHSPRGGGNVLAGYPHLSGQLPAYTIQALIAYREGQRGDGVDQGFIMQQVTAGLSDKEIEAVANYIYGLH